MKKIILTGGGSAGHVIPNIALLPLLHSNDYEVSYIGSTFGIEKQLIEKQNIPYYGIATGKLRRYFSIKNFTDPFLVLLGFFQAFRILGQVRPQLVFSKGGFVAVPVVFAAKLRGIPVIAHESDYTPGLANRLTLPFATKICTTFESTAQHLPSHKAVHTGTPIRNELLQAKPDQANEWLHLKPNDRLLLVIGGSLGAKAINDALYPCLDTLLKDYVIVHLCGKGKVLAQYNTLVGYHAFEYLNDELPSLMARADIIVSRAGVGVLYEMAALAKPNLLIPLSKKASRGDQILNAMDFEKHGLSKVLFEENLTTQTFLDGIKEVSRDATQYINKMLSTPSINGTQAIVALINQTVSLNRSNNRL